MIGRMVLPTFLLSVSGCSLFPASACAQSASRIPVSTESASATRNDRGDKTPGSGSSADTSAAAVKGVVYVTPEFLTGDGSTETSLYFKYEHRPDSSRPWDMRIKAGHADNWEGADTNELE